MSLYQPHQRKFLQIDWISSGLEEKKKKYRNRNGNFIRIIGQYNSCNNAWHVYGSHKNAGQGGQEKTYNEQYSGGPYDHTQMALTSHEENNIVLAKV